MALGESTGGRKLTVVVCLLWKDGKKGCERGKAWMDGGGISFTESSPFTSEIKACRQAKTLVSLHSLLIFYFALNSI